ncbi:hypothetical protein H4R19_005013, partial [Coemansia spiralis]
MSRTHFDTPEGRWTLVSEFTTEAAANQFAPHLAPKLGGDDLSLGTGDSTPPPLPPTPVALSSAKFSAAGAAMGGGGVLFADLHSGSNSSARPPPPPQPQSPRPPAHQLANRPTFVTAFHSPAAECADTGRSAAAGSSASDSGGSRNQGFLKGLKGPGTSSSNGAADHPAGATRSVPGRGIVSKSTSAFVSRIITSENMARWIVNDSGQSTYFLFNAPRSMVLVGMQQQQQ